MNYKDMEDLYDFLIQDLTEGDFPTEYFDKRKMKKVFVAS